jgi:hypothetical protein
MCSSGMFQALTSSYLGIDNPIPGRHGRSSQIWWYISSFGEILQVKVHIRAARRCRSGVVKAFMSIGMTEVFFYTHQISFATTSEHYKAVSLNRKRPGGDKKHTRGLCYRVRRNEHAAQQLRRQSGLSSEPIQRATFHG